MIKNVDLWQDIYEVLQQRREAQEWVKVPSHVDLEGTNTQTNLRTKGCGSTGSGWRRT